MPSISQVIANYKRQTGHYTNGSIGRYGDVNIFYEGKVLYSFGRHFPLAVKADFGKDVEFIINGDRSTHSTNRHQAKAIKVLKPGVQIPFSALAEAWNWVIGPDNSGFFELVNDRNIRLTHEQMKAKFPERNGNFFNLGYYYLDNPIYLRSMTFQTLAGFLTSEHNPLRIVDFWSDGWRHSHDDGKTWVNGYFLGWTNTGEPADAGVVACGSKDCNFVGTLINGEKPEVKQEHRLGAVLFTLDPWAVNRPGQSFKASEPKYFLSSFDELDRNNYFLCHIPGSPSSIEEAYENLKPAEVKLALASNNPVLRQGDWFFVQANPEGRLPKPELKQVRLGGNSGTHVVTRSRTLPGIDPLVVVSGSVRHKPLDGRKPEHKRLTLGTGKDWWIPVKNTSEAGWSAKGQVD